MQRIKSTIVFLDFRKIRFKGADNDMSLSICKDIVDYACLVAQKSGIKTIGVFALLPKGMAKAEMLGTKVLSDNLMSAIADKLKEIESVAVIEGLGEIPSDLKEVCEKCFRSILPFSSLFGAKASTDVTRKIASIKGLLQQKRLYHEPPTRGGRQK